MLCCDYSSLSFDSRWVKPYSKYVCTVTHAERSTRFKKNTGENANLEVVNLVLRCSETGRTDAAAHRHINSNLSLRQIALSAKPLSNVLRPGSSVPISFHLLVSSFCSTAGLCGVSGNSIFQQTNTMQPKQNQS